ncbi:IclR family transcriptional regulator C-terminal domain-containing protein [Arthrobacter sp. ISL-30]|uniref:IclR family transcriptional regulator domain-containing protein n=1 Tax=Arthrobacter sp. ISL-30 TaxID=2819109 RepID=UPI001BEBB8CB|nr:IclR family transcriptional regulator C-terminal domain-containing protein [Arthrobacter sp. ISL-30]MBT2512475.1 hypothetical protein [Arthrobacter sp. ISL-30]
MRDECAAIGGGDHDPGVSSVAAPVFSSVDSLPLTISVVFPTEVVHEDELSLVTTQLLRVTRTISGELGISVDDNSGRSA